jgi:cytidine deaminase
MTEALIEEARRVAERAHAPYSGFRVGAALLSEDGTVYTGANVENAAYPASSCAEANAVGTAVSAGARRFQAVAVACIDAPTVESAYPCGRCRQILLEFDVPRVVVGTAGGEIREHSLEELLPHGFKLDR